MCSWWMYTSIYKALPIGRRKSFSILSFISTFSIHFYTISKMPLNWREHNEINEEKTMNPLDLPYFFYSFTGTEFCPFIVCSLLNTLKYSHWCRLFGAHVLYQAFQQRNIEAHLYRSLKRVNLFHLLTNLKAHIKNPF